MPCVLESLIICWGCYDALVSLLCVFLLLLCTFGKETVKNERKMKKNEEGKRRKQASDAAEVGLPRQTLKSDATEESLPRQTLQSDAAEENLTRQTLKSDAADPPV